ncbi:helix-turn-helix domain-containing protein [Spongiibacter taiwanensis]|uniref:helix-turn-helix domain-containing protein n=1 Tax=Spongiibacter taiwanensis TaxID=1748242 RepID=UPI002034D9F0|nr:helix-turn-helix domain-containing protein [Spongiibacter taiwanensis]USA43007.1 helix-turn-helix domain-containing protein [Spongiibacter taiwanensis]
MPEVNEPIPGPPGTVLQDARINAGKSVVDVAEALNLLKTYVEALENNDYSRFNSPLFARGYIKSYARYMGLDEASLLRDCDRICRRQDERSAQVQQVRAGANAPARGGIVVALVAALLVWLVCVWVFGGGDEAQLEVEALPDRHAGLVELKPVESLGRSLLQQEPLEMRIPEDESGFESHSATLSLQVKESVWLEIRDANNVIVLTGIQPKGKQFSLAVEGPIYFSVAYWPAVALQYNGKPVHFDNIAESKAVRLQVGEI